MNQENVEAWFAVSSSGVNILKIYQLICESLVLDKRRRRAEMAALTIAMLASPKTRTKGGGNHVLLFLFLPSPSRYGRKHEGHPCMEKGINTTVLKI